jgi:hypothetical protein
MVLTSLTGRRRCFDEGAKMNGVEMIRGWSYGTNLFAPPFALGAEVRLADGRLS